MAGDEVRETAVQALRVLLDGYERLATATKTPSQLAV